MTTAEKKRILLNNIYGVDIDVNAVEVTKLSLLLKCMEGETDASIATQLRLFNERILPTLDDNIKSGNSLIDADFYSEELNFKEEKKIKPFSWKNGFPEVFKKGGFDAVIGNPPYLGGREWKEENGNAYGYFIKKYKVAEYQFDIYALFWEAGIGLLKPDGMIGYITPNTWLNNQSNTKLRAFILENTNVSTIVDYSKIKVFAQATVLPVITILEKGKRHKRTTEVYEPVGGFLKKVNTISQDIWQDGSLNIININLSQNDLSIRSKIEANTVSLESVGLIKFGIKIYETGKGEPKQKPGFAKDHVYESNRKVDKTYRPYLEGKDINSYRIEYQNRWLKYGKNLAAPREPNLFEGERILVRRIVGKTLIAAYTNSDYVTSQLLQIVKPHDPSSTKFLLGILNSKLIAFYFRKKYNRQDKTFPEIRIYELASLPMKVVTDLNNKFKVEITKLVDQLLMLKEQVNSASLQSKIVQFQSRIDYCEERINECVYQLYELTAEEIGIVEEA